MNFSRKDVEQAIFTDTDYTENELAEKSLDDLQFIAEVLQHTDTDLDTEELQSAIGNLTN